MGIVDQFDGNSVYLDANIFIYTLEGYEEYVSVLQELFFAVERQQCAAFTSELTIAEVLVKPYSENNTRLVEQYIKALQFSETLSLVPISREILKFAAQIRSEGRPQVKLPDAIHISSAIMSQCCAFITNDRRLKQTNHIKVLLLADYL